MKTARSRNGCINNPNLTYQAEPREVKLRKIINGEANNMEDGVFPTIYTEKKERVRSKSEKIIADMLYHKNIPYKYECPINLKGLGMIYPDFTCLRLADRKTILWEHLGMMTDPIYCQKAMKKIDIYAKNGFIQGRDIIYTFESEKYSLNTMSVENLINQIFST